MPRSISGSAHRQCGAPYARTARKANSETRTIDPRPRQSGTVVGHGMGVSYPSRATGCERYAPKGEVGNVSQMRDGSSPGAIHFLPVPTALIRPCTSECSAEALSPELNRHQLGRYGRHDGRLFSLPARWCRIYSAIVDYRPCLSTLASTPVRKA